MKITVYLFAAITCLIIFSTMVLALPSESAAGVDPFPGNKGSAYAYDQKDILQVFFFPKEQARWNGYEVTSQNWPQLTDHQKDMFVHEGIIEIQLQMGYKIKAGDTSRLLTAMNAAMERLQQPDAVNMKVQAFKMLVQVSRNEGLVATP